MCSSTGTPADITATRVSCGVMFIRMSSLTALFYFALYAAQFRNRGAEGEDLASLSHREGTEGEIQARQRRNLRIASTRVFPQANPSFSKLRRRARGLKPHLAQ